MRISDWSSDVCSSDLCGDSQIMLDQSINLHAGIPRIAVLYLYPQDVVEFHRQARTAGLPVPDLDETFYGMTEFRVDDPDGNRLWIGQQRGASRSEERRVGKEGVSSCRSRWSQD